MVVHFVPHWHTLLLVMYYTIKEKKCLDIVVCRWVGLVALVWLAQADHTNDSRR